MTWELHFNKTPFHVLKLFITTGKMLLARQILEFLIRVFYRHMEKISHAVPSKVIFAHMLQLL